MSLFLLYSCDSSTDPPPEEKPPGYQEDVPWPSLADSPWPMYRCDPQGTGRTNYLINLTGTINWKIDSFYVASGAAITEDSTILIGTNDIFSPNYAEGGLIALKSDGNIKWKFSFKNYAKGISSPVIANDGTIYISSTHERKFYAINPDGSKKWELYIDAMIIQSGICIGKDGTLFALGWKGDFFDLLAISPNGELLWTLSDERFSGETLNGMSLSPDGKTLYIPGGHDGPAVFAVDIENHEIIWEFGEERATISAIPIVDSDGNVYIFAKNNQNQGLLYSLNLAGEIRWEYILDDPWSFVSSFNLFALSKDGDIILGHDKLYCINYQGELKWKVQLEKTIASPITIDNSGNCYFVVEENNVADLLMVDNSGNILQSIPLESNDFSWYSPTITDFGILLNSYNSKQIVFIR